MKQFFQKINFQSLLMSNLSAVLTLVIGIAFITRPAILKTLYMGIGSALILAGIGIAVYGYIRYKSFRPACLPLLIGGVLMCIVPSVLTFLIPVFFGLWIFSSSASGVYRHFTMRRVNPTWWIGFAISVLTSFIGIYIMCRPVTAITHTIRLVGIALTVYSVCRLISLFLGREYQSAGTQQSDSVIETTIKE